ncbi:MAG: glycosyltransferase [Coriobacteriia bacterium]|nr:glycosyltransferase [Coriobacteriia bacterium]
MPKISIAIPVYNVEAHLRECLDSIVSQTLWDIEIICVDDCSDDGSAEILREYASRDPRLRVITFSENKSASQARKDAVLASTGAYVMFVDADDAIVPEACETLYQAMCDDPVDVLQFGTHIANDNNLPTARIEWMEEFLEPCPDRLEGGRVFEACFGEDLYGFTLWNKIYAADLCKRSFARVKDGVFPKAQDTYAYFLLAYHARSYRGIPDELYEYHFGRGGTGHQLLMLPQFERYCSMALVADAIREFLLNEGVLDRYEALYATVRARLLADCVGNWNRHLAREDKAPGFDLMISYWQAPEVIARVAELNWRQTGHVARLLEGAQCIARRPTRVRVVGTYYHRIANGGVQRVMSVLIRLWLDLGYKVVLFTDLPASEDDYDLPDGVVRVVLPSYFEIEPATYIERAQEIDRVVREYEIDVMVYHAWVSSIMLWDLVACRAAGASFVVHCHNVFSMLTRNVRRYFADIPYIYRLADCVVALSEVDKAFWGTFNHETVCMPNPLSYDLRDVPVSSLEGQVVLWLGRVSAEKRPHDALRIFAEVVREEPDAKMLMVGSSTDEKYMDGVRNLVDELGLQDSVVLCGFLRDVLDFYRQASVFLITSEYEGFSMVLSESQSAGVPCVMYDLPYLTLVRARRGIVAVEMGDIGAAADAVVDLLRDPEYRRSLGREARANVEELAQFEFVGAWQSLFDGLAEVREPQPLDETMRIMWDTLLEHYRDGAVRRDSDVSRLRRQLGTTRKQLKAARRVRSSWSFRIGYAITALPRRARKMLTRAQRHYRDPSQLTRVNRG